MPIIVTVIGWLLAIRGAVLLALSQDAKALRCRECFIGTGTERWSWVFLPNIRGFPRVTMHAGNDGEPDEVKASIRPADNARQLRELASLSIDTV